MHRLMRKALPWSCLAAAAVGVVYVLWGLVAA
jgi:hypothetical protein